MTFELVDFPYNGAGVFGVDALKRALSASVQILDAVTPEFDAGDCYADRKICRLSEVRETYRKGRSRRG